jgi:ABC-type nitrate/sulfonate/bicarbonate transport system substrate-binding protein
VSTTILWSVIADQLHNIDYRVGDGKFDIVVEDYFALPDMLMNDECTVVATIPEAAATMLRTGDVEVMYDDRPPWQVYRDEVCQCEHKGMMSNLFVATEEWYDAHPDQAAAFLELWQRGIDLWHQNKEEIVGLYPQHFAVETEEDIEWMVDYMEGPYDWFVDTVYMDEEWIDRETELYGYMRQAGWMTADTEIPRFEALAPPS